MERQKKESGQNWARQQFGKCKLGDWRRTERAVQIGEAIMKSPGKTLPQQMQSPALLKAAYRFMDEPGISYPALMKPHWEQTRAKLKGNGVVLLIQDLTEVDYRHYQSIDGLGPVGDGLEWEHGYLLSTVLGVVPQPRQVLGIAYQEPFLRQARPEKETRTQRARRPKESDFWLRGVEAVGRCPAGEVWVHVGDRGSDMYTFMATCRAQNSHFLLRACQNRKMLTGDGEVNYVLDFARQLPAMEERVLQLPAGHGHPAREARVRLAFSPLTLSHGWMNPGAAPIPAWVIRVWEVDPTPDVAEPVDWYLLTSLPTDSVEQAWERVEWYRCRWLVEDFHQCLKTGCHLEQRRLQHKDRLFRLLGLLAPVAVQLLILREQSRLDPERLASTVISPDLLRLVAHLAQRSPAELTLHSFWRLVAQFGGYLGRKRDGPPGWKSLWHGWLYLQNLLEGIHLAADLDP
jgi:hypothetical protein